MTAGAPRVQSRPAVTARAAVLVSSWVEHTFGICGTSFQLPGQTCCQIAIRGLGSCSNKWEVFVVCRSARADVAGRFGAENIKRQAGLCLGVCSMDICI